MRIKNIAFSRAMNWRNLRRWFRIPTRFLTPVRELNQPTARRRYVPAVGPRLRRVLIVVLALFALLSVNALYLSSVTFTEWLTGQTYQDYFYQFMFLGHLVLGLLIILPVVVYGAVHIRNAHARPNRRAVRVGHALFVVSLLLLGTGLVLTRGIPLIEVRQAMMRDIAYWLHVVSPLVAVWLFILHRLAGPKNSMAGRRAGGSDWFGVRRCDAGSAQPGSSPLESVRASVIAGLFFPVSGKDQRRSIHSGRCINDGRLLPAVSRRCA